MNTTGGRFSLTINGAVYSGRGEAKINPSRVELENGANQDGSGYSTVKPILTSLELTFDRGVGLVWDETMMLQTVNVTFIETDAGVTHLFTGGRWSGKPELNTKDGEVSGLKIETDQYTGI